MKTLNSDHLKIDLMQLEIEADEQPELFFKYAQQAIEAKEAADLAKLEFEQTEARVDKKIRMDPSDYDIEKITEKAVNGAVVLDKAYVTARTHHLEKQLEYTLLQRMVDALEQRKRMLELLVALHGQQYFAGPNIPHNLGNVIKDRTALRNLNTKKAENVIKKKAKKRTTKK